VRYALAVLLCFGSLAAADAADGGSGSCRTVEIVMQPVPHVQMAVWVEDDQGNYLATLYVTRLTGSLGLANRPGLPTFKSDYRYPYGSRQMVMPVWAHARNHTYGQVVMGGGEANGAGMITDTTTCGSNCDNTTIGYHSTVSSNEPFYCGPQGGTGGLGLDATSCASSFYGSKGAYLVGGRSYYPPRADLTSFQTDDSNAARAYASVNDLGAVSGATPPGNAVIDPAIRWTPPADGQYVMKAEVSMEYDFNAYNDHPPTPDAHVELQSFGLADSGNTKFGQPGFKYGTGGFGQPSIVYAVPFTVGDSADIETTATYVGYGDWDGSTGTMHSPDTTITTSTEGTGVGRLLLTSDSAGSWRMKVSALAECDGDGGSNTCAAPNPPEDLQLVPGDTSLTVSFASAGSGPQTTRFDVRYRVNGDITDADFLSAVPPSTPPPTPGAPGSTVSLDITGLRPTQDYHVAVRSIATCGATSEIVVADATTVQQKFTTLHGCFIATAAYGTPMAREIDTLRRFRDRHLMTNALGRVFVAGYYSMSPPIASLISGSRFLRSRARSLIGPMVAWAAALERVESRLDAIAR
jgi:hypothetical protein